MQNPARQSRENRTITIDFQNEATYFQLLDDGQAFLECVLAFVLSMGFQLKHKATCHGGERLTRHSHYVRFGWVGSPSGGYSARRVKRCSRSCHISSCATARCDLLLLATSCWQRMVGSV